jgi:hypothetical protein
VAHAIEASAEKDKAMTPEQITRQLENLAFMFDLSDSLKAIVVATLAEVSRLEQVSPDTVLLAPDDSQPDTGFVLLGGSVEIQGADGFGTTLEPPVILGEMKQFHFEHSSKRMATVRAVCEVNVLRFQWPELYTALEARISAAEMTEFRTALHDHAWMHYLELQDEL